MLVKNLTLLLNRKQIAANRMALSDLKTDIWKVGFSAIVVFYSFRPSSPPGGDHWRHDAGQESDIIFILEIDSCKSNGVVRLQNGHLEGWFLWDCRVLFISPSSPSGGDHWRHDAGQESDTAFE